MGSFESVGKKYFDFLYIVSCRYPLLDGGANLRLCNHPFYTRFGERPLDLLAMIFFEKRHVNYELPARL